MVYRRVPRAIRVARVKANKEEFRKTYVPRREYEISVLLEEKLRAIKRFSIYPST